MSDLNEQSKLEKKSTKLLKGGLIGFGLTTILVIFLPLIVTKFSFISLGVDKPNEIGDSIGGIMGPAVGLIAAALTFLAFWAQYDANIEQRRQFGETLERERKKNELENIALKQQQEKEFEEFKIRQNQFDLQQKLQQDQILLQDKRARLDLFETRFYNMLSIQRENANKMEVKNVNGRKVFLHMIDELRFIYLAFTKFYKDPLVRVNDVINEKEMFNLSYLSFFFGIGDKSTPLVLDLVGEKYSAFITNSHQKIIELKKTFELLKQPISIELSDGVITYNSVYGLGTGHLRRLSHYVRHLFQMVKFVDEQDNRLINDEEKYNYISNIRAQLSAHEQILLYYNSMSVLGQPWLEVQNNNTENYFEKYCILKSIPLNAVDFYQNPLMKFPESNKAGKDMFEWIEIKKRFSNL